jgi:hypothetical protein
MTNNETAEALDSAALDQELYFLSQSVARAAEDLGDHVSQRVDRVLPEVLEYVHEMFKGGRSCASTSIRRRRLAHGRDRNGPPMGLRQTLVARP